MPADEEPSSETDQASGDDDAEDTSFDALKALTNNPIVRQMEKLNALTQNPIQRQLDKLKALTDNAFNGK